MKCFSKCGLGKRPREGGRRMYRSAGKVRPGHHVFEWYSGTKDTEKDIPRRPADWREQRAAKWREWERRRSATHDNAPEDHDGTLSALGMCACNKCEPR